MLKINKILKPRYLLALLVLGGGALFTMLQATSNECFSTADGDLTEQSTFGTYQGSAQSECGSNLALDYIISAGNIVSWSGFEGPITGNVEVKSGGSLDINGNATFGGTLTNAGTVTLEAPTNPDNASVDNSTFFTITNPSGHTSENGTTSTFNVVLNESPAEAVPDTPTIPSSDFFNISAPSSAASGHTKEDNTTSTFTVKLRNSPELDTPETVTAPSSDFYNISAPSSAAGGHTEEGGTTSTFNVSLKAAPTENVTVDVSSSETAEATIAPATLTFTPANYNAAQTVTVTGVDDNSTDGHKAYDIELKGVHSPHRYWRIRNLAKKYAWNIKEIQFLSNTTLYDANQNTIAQPESSALHNGANCIQSGQYGSMDATDLLIII